VAPYGDRGENADIYRWAFFYGPLWLMEVVVTVNLLLIWVYVRDVTKKSENHILYGNRVRANIDTETGTSIHFEVLSSMFMANNSTNAGDRPADETPVKSSTRKSFVVSAGFQRSMSSRRRIDSASQSQLAKRRKQVANQCFRYGGAFYFTWIPITVRNSENSCGLAASTICSMSKADSSYYFLFSPLVQLVRLFETADVEVMYGFLLLAATNTPFQGLPNFLVYLYPKLTKPELAFWGRGVRKATGGESNKSVDNLIEQRLKSHEEGEEPANTGGTTRQKAVISSASIPISSEDNIELVGDRATTRRKDNSSETETNY
jgi:hypothetical protein